MAHYCRFWTMTPADYWALTYAEHQTLKQWMDGERRHNEREARKAKARARRKR